jgi:hypothetical protein
MLIKPHNPSEASFPQTTKLIHVNTINHVAYCRTMSYRIHIAYVTLFLRNFVVIKVKRYILNLESTMELS